MRRTIDFLDANGNVIPRKHVHLYVVNLKRRWRKAPEITLGQLVGMSDRELVEGTEEWRDCITLNILRCIISDCSGKTIEEAMQQSLDTQSGFATCAALYTFGVRKFS